MKNIRNRAVLIEVVLAIPLLLLLWILAGEFIEKYGLVILPVGIAVYLVIATLVDKLFSRQSEQLEQALERKLSFGGDKSGAMQKDC